MQFTPRYIGGIAASGATVSIQPPAGQVWRVLDVQTNARCKVNGANLRIGSGPEEDWNRNMRALWVSNVLPLQIDFTGSSQFRDYMITVAVASSIVPSPGTPVLGSGSLAAGASMYIQPPGGELWYFDYLVCTLTSSAFYFRIGFTDGVNLAESLQPLSYKPGAIISNGLYMRIRDARAMSAWDYFYSATKLPASGFVTKLQSGFVTVAAGATAAIQPPTGKFWVVKMMVGDGSADEGASLPDLRMRVYQDGGWTGPWEGSPGSGQIRNMRVGGDVHIPCTNGTYVGMQNAHASASRLMAYQAIDVT